MWFLGLLIVIAIIVLLFSGAGKVLLKIALCIGVFSFCLACIPIPGVNIVIAIAICGYIIPM